MLLTLGNVGDSNLVKDQSEYDMPPNYWSNGKNIRFRDNAVERMLGHQLMTTGTIAPYFLLPTRWGASLYLVYAGAAAVYAWDYTTHTNITRASGGAYSANHNSWTGGVLHGILFLNNGTDVPQSWEIPPSLGTPLVALPNWPSAYRAGALRQFGNFLVAMDITKTSVRYPQLVLWSHPADPGSVPSSWDTADATKDAGELPLSETPGAVVDGLMLRRNFMMYKEDSMHVMSFVGGSKIMDVNRVALGVGILARNCVTAFSNKGEQHAIMGPDDCYITDGVNVQSLLTGTWRKWLYNVLNVSTAQKSFVVHNQPYKEIWFCIPTTGSTLPNLALIWNYETQKFGVRDLPSATHMASAIPTLAGLGSWAASTYTWETIPGTWGESEGSQLAHSLVMAVPASNKIMLMDKTNQFDGVNFESYIERIGMTAIGQDLEGKLIQDTQSRKLATEVWPHVAAQDGVTLQVQVGRQEKMDATIEWSTELPFVHGTDEKVNPYIAGKYLAVRFKSTANEFWRLRDYSIEVKKVGKY